MAHRRSHRLLPRLPREDPAPARLLAPLSCSLSLHVCGADAPRPRTREPAPARGQHVAARWLRAGGPGFPRQSVPEPPARASPLRTGLCGREGGSGRDRLGLRLAPRPMTVSLEDEGRFETDTGREAVVGRWGQRWGDAPSKPGAPTTAGGHQQLGGRPGEDSRSEPPEGTGLRHSDLDFRAPARGTIQACRSGLPACGGLQRRPARQGCQSLACEWLDRPVTYA